MTDVKVMGPSKFAELIRSGKGTTLAVDDYMYKMDKKPMGNFQHWRCLKQNCTGRIKTTCGPTPVVHSSKPHTHQPDPKGVQVKRMKMELCERVREHPFIPLSKIYSSWVEEHKDLDPSLIPSFAGCNSTMHRFRKAMQEGQVPGASHDPFEESGESNSSTSIKPPPESPENSFDQTVQDYDVPVQFDPLTTLKMEVDTEILPSDHNDREVMWGDHQSVLATPHYYVEKAPSESDGDEIVEVNVELVQSDFVQWRQVALNNNLAGDRDVAAFLLRIYERFMQEHQKPSTCNLCHRSLPQVPRLCSICKQKAKTNQPSATSTADSRQRNSHNSTAEPVPGTFRTSSFNHRDDYLDPQPSTSRQEDNFSDRITKPDPEDRWKNLDPVYRFGVNVDATTSAAVKSFLERKDCFPDARPIQYYCDQCSLIFPSHDALQEHMSVRHPTQTIQPTQCQACKASYKRLLTLVQPHPGGQPYLCPFCGHGSSRLEEFQGHLLNHSQEKRFRCAKCAATQNHNNGIVNGL